ncbi:cathepsin L-like proteinase [Mixophyes fleayi]|uniref:cathepsin L-like proteinase n=1 Tax=Mixophyes fleayi TaxID=3061075 RepID=UPI003F4E09D1
MHLDKQLFALSAIIICASSSHFLDQEWNAWKSKYEKKYITSPDELFRRKAWEETWHKVQKHNRLAEQGLTKYTMAMNRFADMTPEERSSRNCLSSKKDLSVKKNIPVQVHAKNLNIPESVDWRESGCVAKVKNQGDFCGSCWAFATVGVIESRYCIKKEELVLLSEQQLVDCDEANDGCCGGDPATALKHVTRYGVMKAKDYEYSEKKFTCLYKPDNAITFNVTKYYILPGEDNMASSVALDGPITVGIDASSDFMMYCNGIFSGECGKAEDDINHAVIIVGYGTEYDEEEDEKIDYWIIRNSWGEDWGDKGYAKMRRNVNQCGIALDTASVDLEH